ncbi:hypothetical protein, partial [Novosphingobium gossypii]|uniref:hypothetical protein n=1 Tax=Novosphingobium gossypii TaxID=1604774 RepID=UPI003D1B91B7
CFKLVSTTRRSAEPGAVAHMSLHQKPTMSKTSQDNKPGQLLVPGFNLGEQVARQCLATPEEAVFRCGESASKRRS